MTEEFETPVEIFAKVPINNPIPRSDIEAFLAENRIDGYQMFRRLTYDMLSFTHLKLQFPDVDIDFRLSMKPMPVDTALADFDLSNGHRVVDLWIQKGALEQPSANSSILFKVNAPVMLGRAGAMPNMPTPCSPIRV